MRAIFMGAAISCCCAAMFACEGSSPTGTNGGKSSDAVSLALVVSPPSSARSGVAFATAPVVELRDARDRRVARAGVPVQVSVENGSASPGPDTVATTTSDGRATFARLQLVGHAAVQRVTFSSPGLRSASVDVTLLPGPPAWLTVTSGDRQWGRPGAPLQLPPTVRVIDQAGNGVAGVAVTFVPAEGSGTVEHATVTTDLEGLARAGTWTLGAATGREHLLARADASGLEPVALTAVAMPASLRFAALATVAEDAMCGVTPDGAGWCWGADGEGQLGDSAALPLNELVAVLPVPIAGAVHLTQVSVRPYACAIGEGGVPYCWGRTPTDFSVYTTPIAVEGSSALTAISAGGWLGHTFACGLDAGGLAYCWGENESGELGTGDTQYRDVPTPVAGGLQFATIAAGGAHVCALTLDGTAYCWGRTNHDRGIDLTPTPVPGGLAFASISASVLVTCGVTREGKGYCWGFGEDGRLGDGASHAVDTPSAVAGDITFVSISAGAGESCGVGTDGAAWCWGGNHLGDGMEHRSLVPVRVSGDRVFRAVTVLGSGACALATDGRAYCWGANAHGELGNGTMRPSLVPTAVAP